MKPCNLHPGDLLADGCRDCGHVVIAHRQADRICSVCEALGNRADDHRPGPECPRCDSDMLLYGETFWDTRTLRHLSVPDMTRKMVPADSAADVLAVLASRTDSLPDWCEFLTRWRRRDAIDDAGPGARS